MGGKLSAADEKEKLVVDHKISNSSTSPNIEYGTTSSSKSYSKDARISVTSKEYDPFENRSPEHPTTDAETLIHLLKGSIGTGILAMANATYNAGLVIAVIGTFLVGAICTYCVHMMVRSEILLCRKIRKPFLNYPDMAVASFREGPKVFKALSPYAGHFVNIVLLVYQIGSCCVYTVFIASNIKEVVDSYQSSNPMDLRLYIAILFVPLVLINFIRNLKMLAPLTTVANLITVIGFGITLYYIFTDLPSIDEREIVGDISNFPLFLGTVLFALESIGVVMPLENNMKTPKSFPKIINIAMSFIIVLYATIGFFGYWKYGELAKEEGSITLNLPKDEPLAQSVKIMLAVAIYVTHALQFYVAIDILWNMWLHPWLKNRSAEPEKDARIFLIWELIVRAVLVLICTLLAIAFPKLDLIISLFGALCLSTLGIVMPALIETSFVWYNSGLGKWNYILVKNSLLVIFGVIGLVIGTYTSITNMIEEL